MDNENLPFDKLVSTNLTSIGGGHGLFVSVGERRIGSGAPTRYVLVVREPFNEAPVEAYIRPNELMGLISDLSQILDTKFDPHVCDAFDLRHTNTQGLSVATLQRPEEAQIFEVCVRPELSTTLDHAGMSHFLELLKEAKFKLSELERA